MIEIMVISLAGMAPAVIPSPDRVKSTVNGFNLKIAELNKRIARLDRGTEALNNAIHEKTSLESQRDRLIALTESLHERFADSIKTLKFNFSPYTWGQKQMAIARATTYESGRPIMDPNKLRHELAIAATGMGHEEFGALAPSVAEALANECMERSEPDPERMDFLFTSPQSFVTTE